MKKAVRFLFAMMLMALFCVACFGQKDNRMYALPENATLEETQAWLIRMITSNSAYRLKDAAPVKDVLKTDPDGKEVFDSKISAVKFEGCVMSYSIQKNSQIQQQKVIVGQGLPAAGSSETVKVLFNLSDINPDEVSLQETEENGVMSVINMRTFDYKRVIKIKGSADTGNITVSVASLVVGTNIAEQAKNALIHAMALCRATK